MDCLQLPANGASLAGGANKYAGLANAGEYQEFRGNRIGVRSFLNKL
jgi:hypothetical protein